MNYLLPAHLTFREIKDEIKRTRTTDPDATFQILGKWWRVTIDKDDKMTNETFWPEEWDEETLFKH